MKKITRYVVIFILCLFITGCNSEPAYEENINSENKNTEEIDNSSNDDTTENDSNEDSNEIIVYKDVVADIVGAKPSDKIVIYFFHGDGCPHCSDENIFLEDLLEKYSDYIIIRKYETWFNETNAEFLNFTKSYFNITSRGVPFTVIGEEYFSGYSDSTGIKIESTILRYLKSIDPKLVNEKGELIVDRNTEILPILGKVNVRNASIVTIAIVLGFIDGFNPCAMWVLLFLIGMLFNMKNKRRMWILGYTFLLASSIFYFFAIFFLDIFLSTMTTKVIRYLIGIVAIAGGLFNLKKYYSEPKDGCVVTTDNKRKKIMERIKKFTREKNIFLALGGVVALAVSVNIIEIMCTTGFPTIFLSILEINHITGFSKIMYLLIYICLYMLDDLVVFIVSMITLEATGISTKYNKLSHLVGGILMVLMGLLLIFKYNWLMFEF